MGFLLEPIQLRVDISIIVIIKNTFIIIVTSHIIQIITYVKRIISFLIIIILRGIIWEIIINEGFIIN